MRARHEIRSGKIGQYEPLLRTVSRFSTMVSIHAQGLAASRHSRQQRSRLQRTRSLRHWEEAVLLLITPAGSFFRTGKRCTRPNCMLWLSFPGRALPQFYAPPRHPLRRLMTTMRHWRPLKAALHRLHCRRRHPCLRKSYRSRLHRSSCWLL